MENKDFFGKEWWLYGVLYPLGVIVLAAAMESLSRIFF